MQSAIAEVSEAIKVLRNIDPFGPDVKASEELLEPLFRAYFEKLRLPSLIQKSDYHILAHLAKPAEIDAEVAWVLDRIVEVAERARPQD